MTGYCSNLIIGQTSCSAFLFHAESDVFQTGKTSKLAPSPTRIFSRSLDLILRTEQIKGCQKSTASSIALHMLETDTSLLWYMSGFPLRCKHLFNSLKRSSIQIVLSASKKPGKAKSDINTGHQRMRRIRYLWYKLVI